MKSTNGYYRIQVSCFELYRKIEPQRIKFLYQILIQIFYSLEVWELNDTNTVYSPM